MTWRNKYKCICLLFLLIVDVRILSAQNVNVVITGIRSSRGQIVIGIYKDEKSFRDDAPCMSKKYKKGNISNGKMTVNLNLAPGTYGFAFLDDENNDNKMNYGFLQQPQEGFGFSNYYLKKLARPQFDAFKFELKEGQTKKIVCRLKYMP